MTTWGWISWAAGWIIGSGLVLGVPRLVAAIRLRRVMRDFRAYLVDKEHRKKGALPP